MAISAIFTQFDQTIILILNQNTSHCIFSWICPVVKQFLESSTTEAAVFCLLDVWLQNADSFYDHFYYLNKRPVVPPAYIDDAYVEDPFLL